MDDDETANERSETLQLLSTLNVPQAASSNLVALNDMGSQQHLTLLLSTSSTNGIKSDTVSERAEEFGKNEVASPPMKTWLTFFVDSFDDLCVQILMVSAVVSLVIGIYDDPSSGYVEGVAILLAVLIVAVVTACNDYSKEVQFRSLSAVNDDIDVKVIRDGSTQYLSTLELVVGDVVSLESGDRIPADCVVLSSDNLSVNESSLTGEPEDLPKDIKNDPFLLSGCTVMNGSTRAVVIAVGKRSQWGVIKSKLVVEHGQTPLQEKLDDMAATIGYVGMAAAAATFIAMMFIHIVVKPPYLKDTSVFTHALDAFIIAVTIVVVAVPEGLPLAVTISLAFSTKKMLADQNLIRHLQACETMGNATNICSDKTGTLTENRMTVVDGVYCEVESEDGKIPSSSLSSSSLASVVDLISTCSTASLAGEDNKAIVGSATEGAFLLCLSASGFDYKPIRSSKNFGSLGGGRLFPFNSSKKSMSVIVETDTGSYTTQNGSPISSNLGNSCSWTLFHKGAAEDVLARCSTLKTADGKIVNLSAAKRKQYSALIQRYAEKALRCVAMAEKVSVEDVVDVHSIDDAGEIEEGLTLLGVVGICDPLRPDVVSSVATCQQAGIMVRMVTGDNLTTACAIAREAGILTTTPDGVGEGVAMVGADFRNLSKKELDKVLPRLQVLARSSPEDKHALVQHLSGGGEVVGVTGDGTNDAPALKAADVGLAMGISGTDVAKDASDIIIMDDNFGSIVKAVLWGRSVYDNIRRFLQFQLTVNVVALTITFVSAVCGYKPPLNAVMMLWVNLIMDTMGALALGTEPPTLSLLNRRPYKRESGLISLPMWRNILCQSLYQLILLSWMLKDGAAHFGCEDGGVKHFTLIFNSFVMCQIFNEFNAREIGDSFKPFASLASNPFFIAIIAVTGIGQYFIIEFGGNYTQTVPLTEDEWASTVFLGALSIPLGFFMRLIPVKERESSFAGESRSGSGSVAAKKAEKRGSDDVVNLVIAIVAIGVMYFVQRGSGHGEPFDLGKLW